MWRNTWRLCWVDSSIYSKGLLYREIKGNIFLIILLGNSRFDGPKAQNKDSEIKWPVTYWSPYAGWTGRKRHSRAHAYQTKVCEQCPQVLGNTTWEEGGGCCQISCVSGMEPLPGTRHNVSGLQSSPLDSEFAGSRALWLYVMWTHPNSGRKLKKAPVLKSTCPTYLSILPCYPLALLLDSVPGGPFFFSLKKYLFSIEG